MFTRNLSYIQSLFLLIVLAMTAHAAGTHLDFGFGADGTTRFSFGNTPSTDAPWSVALQSDGKIVVVGRTNVNSTWDFAVARINPDGTADATFDTDGMVTIDFNSNIDSAWSVAIQADGKIVVAGESLGANSDIAVARLTTTGALDASFDGDGKTTIDFQNSADIGWAIAIQPDAKIVVAGLASGGTFGLVRLTSGGTPDGTFGTNGRVTTAFGQNGDVAKAVIVLPDGKLLAGGTVFAGGNGNFGLARYNADGTLDTSFNSTGKVVTDIGTFSGDQVTDMKRMADGRIVIAGMTNMSGGFLAMVIVRYNGDGTLDTSFDTDGKVTTMFNPNGNNQLRAIEVTSNGKIIGACAIDSQAYNNGFNVVMYRSDGSLDPTFGAGGRVSTVFGQSERDARDVVLQPNGQIIAVGAVRGYGDFGVARYNTTGIAAVSDFDGGARADFAVFRTTDGIWYQKNSATNAESYTHFGGPGDLPAPGDYDGDGKTDAAIYRRSTSVWYILRSSDNVFVVTPFGLFGDTFVQSDYDADSRTDIAVFRPSTGIWYIQRSSAGFMAMQYGSSSDRPVPGDYDGDGLTDIAIYRPSDGSWWINGTFQGLDVVRFGLSSDHTVPADYDGDNATDIAVFRSSTGEWFIKASQSNSLIGLQWGKSGDRPSPADFDADGRADISVFRPGNGFWYVLQSRDLSVRSLEWGRIGDLPVPEAYFSTATAP